MITYIVVDIESTGPIPGDYSIVSLGATLICGEVIKYFKINLKPISENFHKNHLNFVELHDSLDPKIAMKEFDVWIKNNSKGKLIFVSDNNGFDWMFVCWYFWHFLGENPFGYNSYNINSLYKGLKSDISANIEELRKRKLLHDALEDSKDNAEIFLELLKTIST